MFVHTVNMMRLEEPDGTVLSWEDSQALICRLFQRVVTPGMALVHDWEAGDLVFCSCPLLRHASWLLSVARSC